MAEGPQTPEDPLKLDLETMRRLGYATVDMLVQRLADPGAGPALRRASPKEMRNRVGGPPPAEGESFEQVLETLCADVLPFASRCEHPRYLAFIPACPTWPGALGDFVASALNPYVGSWMESAGPSQVELEVIRWFSSWVGFPDRAEGILVSGGSQANMTALACARETRLGTMTERAVAYFSDQAHSSLARAARVLGFQPHQVRVLPVDEHYRMRPDALREAMAADARAGRTPLFVCACAGATNTGAIDPLAEIARVCEPTGAWLHVDAAYGGFAALTERGHAALAGIERADSITLDPHKWLYQPFECGCLLVREGGVLREAFEIVPEYLRDAVVGRDEVNFADLGLQLSRGFRALKVWMSLRVFGTRAFAQAIDRCLDLASAAQQSVEASCELELLNPASLGIVCFRRHPPGIDDEGELDRLNADLVARFAASGEGLVSSTRLRGCYAIRLCVLNHTTAAGDIEHVLRWFAAQTPSEPAAPAARLRGYEREAPLERTLLRPDPPLVPERERIEAETLRGIALFSRLDVEQLERVRALARERRAHPGEMIIEQWEASRDFFVVVEGDVEVLRDGRPVAQLRRGDFFGELAALEWGASFAYARMASVVVREPTRLLAFSSEALNALIIELPELERRVTRIRRERLAGV